MLQQISRGVNTVVGLSESMDMSVPRIYATASALRKKGAVYLKDGTIIPERHTFLNLLLTMLHDHTSAAHNLSGNGLDVLVLLLDGRNISDLSYILGDDRRTVMSRIEKMKRNGIVYKEGRVYKINDVFWPDLRKLVTEYDTFRTTIDFRVPPDSRTYFSSRDHAVFSNDRDIDYQKTAFSVYGEYGVTVFANTNYYCTLSAPPTLSEVMEHSMEIITADKDKRLRMAALIFYKKYIDEFGNIKHPMKEEMDEVLRTKERAAEGWLPIGEMQTRAEMYGVDLCDL
ncbi:MAG: hypothetical protein FWC44_02670 [Methanomassiliicoccaceae archaeon]|nr:hypothetical protein [Methanomassiliicoccaceae archaeon]